MKRKDNENSFPYVWPEQLGGGCAVTDSYGAQAAMGEQEGRLGCRRPPDTLTSGGPSQQVAGAGFGSGQVSARDTEDPAVSDVQPWEGRGPPCVGGSKPHLPDHGTATSVKHPGQHLPATPAGHTQKMEGRALWARLHLAASGSFASDRELLSAPQPAERWPHNFTS